MRETRLSVAFWVILTERPSGTFQRVPIERARGRQMPPPVRFTGMTCRLFGMKLQVSARQGSVARIRDTGTRNGDVEGVVSDSGLAVIAGAVHGVAVPVDVVHTRAAGKGHAYALGDRPERVDRQAVHLQTRGVVDVLELAVEHAASRAGVGPESGDIAARPKLPA